MKNLVTDAGYESEENYEKISKMGIVPLLEYGTYQKEQTKKYIKDPSKKHNWLYSVEKNEYVDNNGAVFKYVYTRAETIRLF